MGAKFLVTFLCGAALFVSAIPGAGISGSARAQTDPRVIGVPADDAEMSATIAHARDTLPTFWASYDAPKPTGHSLKVRFPASDNYGHVGFEYIWMVNVQKRANNTYSGSFGNTPEHIAGRKLGDVAEFTDADISDWLFLRNGKIVGGETIRVLLKRMPKEEADRRRARFETP